MFEDEKSQIWENDFHPSFFSLLLWIGSNLLKKKNTVMRKMNGLITVRSVSCSLSTVLIHFLKMETPNQEAPCYRAFTQHRLHFKTETRRAIQHTLTTEPLSPTAWLSHQRIQLGSLLLNIITLNKVAFLIFVSFCREIEQKERCLSLYSVLWTWWQVKRLDPENVYLFVKLCGLCLVPKLHLI